MVIDRITIIYKNGEIKQFYFDISVREEMIKRDKLILKARKNKEIDSYNIEINLKQWEYVM